MSPLGNDADYGRGWSAARRGSDTALERADDRGESSRWYDGYFDYACGRSKFATVRDVEGRIVQPACNR